MYIMLSLFCYTMLSDSLQLGSLVPRPHPAFVACSMVFRSCTGRAWERG